MIDIVDVRTAIKKGELRVYVKERNVFSGERNTLTGENRYATEADIYLQDCQNGETVLIGRLDQSDVERIISMHKRLAWE